MDFSFIYGNIEIVVGLISAITALIAVIVSPVVALLVAKIQTNASVISSNRQIWINRLRDELTIFVGILHHIPSAYAAEYIDKTQAVAEYERLIKKLQIIQLLINPKELEHQQLIQLLELAEKIVINSIDTQIAPDSEIREAAKNIVDQSQIILKKEWNRVKSGK